jgi:hypothetical protein
MPGCYKLSGDNLMPITFNHLSGKNQFESRWIGTITDEQLLTNYRHWFDSDEYVAGLHELADLTESDLRSVTSEGLRALMHLVADTYKARGVTGVKCAALVSYDLQYGLLRMYELLASDSPEKTQVFRDREAALQWLDAE